jgi:copper resistance protein D
MSGELLGAFGFFTVLLRAAILCFQTIAMGGIIFLLVVARAPQFRREEWLRPASRVIRWSSLGFALSQIFFATINTLVLTSSTDLSVREVLGANYMLAAYIGLAAGLALFFWPGGLRHRAGVLLLIPAAAMIAATVMTSHAASRMDDRFALISITTVHYLAAAAWIGGVICLLLVLKHVDDLDVLAPISRRFSRLAQFSVAALFLAGLCLSFWFVGSWSAVYGTSYGIMVVTKAILLGCLLLLGAANYFLVRAIGKGPDDAVTKISLIRFAEVEIGIGLTVILAAASLTSQPPGVDLTQDRVTLHEIAMRYSPRVPRFTSPPVKSMSKSSKDERRRAKAAGRKLPSSFVPGSSGIGVNTPDDIAWSEYNHSWAGVVVFLMGILALLSRSRYFAWAKIWPLMFLGLAVFLFFRADPENWPLGPNGFWESFGSADVLQHRFAVILIIVFAVFQYRVETNRVHSHAAALVFPAVCALGGVVLLTHTHALSNVKEQLLVELSHTPLAIFAVVAGWSRWLELRLPPANPTRKYLAWVWPVCFIFIGLLLMNYHEADTAVSIAQQRLNLSL